MKPAPFSYVAARSISEAVALKGEHGGDASFLAGGQSLVPILNFRLAQPAVLIDINDVDACDSVTFADGRLCVGSLTRYRALQRDPAIATHAPLIAEALPFIAHPQIRNRGTLGGNLAHADPASELPAIMLAMNARMCLRSAARERWLNARDFFVGALSTALATDEMLVQVELPAIAQRSGTSFMEISRRRGDFAIMGIAVMLTLRDDDSCADARLAYCGAGDGPVQAITAAASLIGRQVNDTDIAAAAAYACREVDPLGSIHASQDYQRHLAGVLTRRALKVALDRARKPATAERSSQ
jgi:carbon-monoxide dehydrogenase medium subunit